MSLPARTDRTASPPCSPFRARNDGVKPSPELEGPPRKGGPSLHPQTLETLPGSPSGRRRREHDPRPRTWTTTKGAEKTASRRRATDPRSPASPIRSNTKALTTGYEPTPTPKARRPTRRKVSPASELVHRPLPDRHRSGTKPRQPTARRRGPASPRRTGEPFPGNVPPARPQASLDRKAPPSPAGRHRRSPGRLGPPLR